MPARTENVCISLANIIADNWKVTKFKWNKKTSDEPVVLFPI